MVYICIEWDFLFPMEYQCIQLPNRWCVHNKNLVQLFTCLKLCSAIHVFKKQITIMLPSLQTQVFSFGCKYVYSPKQTEKFKQVNQTLSCTSDTKAKHVCQLVYVAIDMTSAAVLITLYIVLVLYLLQGSVCTCSKQRLVYIIILLQLRVTVIGYP